MERFKKFKIKAEKDNDGSLTMTTTRRTSWRLLNSYYKGEKEGRNLPRAIPKHNAHAPRMDDGGEHDELLSENDDVCRKKKNKKKKNNRVMVMTNKKRLQKGKHAQSSKAVAELDTSSKAAAGPNSPQLAFWRNRLSFSSFWNCI